MRKFHPDPIRSDRGSTGRYGAACVVMGLLLLAAQTRAGEIEPRSYVNAPIGINFLIAGYSYSDGGLATDASSPLQDARLIMHTGILAYARSIDLWGMSGKFDVIVPYSRLAGEALVSGLPRERNVSGLLDPRVRLSMIFYGAPATALQDFAGYQQDLIVGASVQVSAPLGQYDPSKLVNLGNNRWFIKPDLGISKAWGPLVIELSTGVLFFTTNDDFFGGQTLEQDPLVTSQFHVTYSLGKGVWAAVSGTYDNGGRTTTNGVVADDVAHNSRYGGMLAVPVSRNHSIKGFVSSGVQTRTGSDYTLVGIAWQFRWGSGL